MIIHMIMMQVKVEGVAPIITL